MIPVTGNIYHESFRDNGVLYTNHYADCAECGLEIGLHGFRRGQTVTNRLKSQYGWGKKLYYSGNRTESKWVCKSCLTATSDTANAAAQLRVQGTAVSAPLEVENKK